MAHFYLQLLSQCTETVNKCFYPQMAHFYLQLLSQCTETVNKCFYPQMAMIQMDYNLKFLGWTFQVVSACLGKSRYKLMAVVYFLFISSLKCSNITRVVHGFSCLPLISGEFGSQICDWIPVTGVTPRRKSVNSILWPFEQFLLTVGSHYAHACFSFVLRVINQSEQTWCFFKQPDTKCKNTTERFPSLPSLASVCFQFWLICCVIVCAFLFAFVLFGHLSPLRV